MKSSSQKKNIYVSDDLDTLPIYDLFEYNTHALHLEFGI